MKKIILIAAVCLSFSVNAKTFDLVRSVNNYVGYIQGTKSGDYTQTGTMTITGNQITRSYTICISSKCQSFTYNDEILYAADYRALIAGDSGDLVSVEILSLTPNIIIMQEKNGAFEIQEYKPR